MVAVGGTSPAWTGKGSRSKTSLEQHRRRHPAASRPSPATTGRHGAVRPTRREADAVAFNRQPYTRPVHVAAMAQLSSTSVELDQRGRHQPSRRRSGSAALAVANALRAQGGKASALALPHGTLYSSVAKTPGTPLDVTTGSNGGSCGTPARQRPAADADRPGAHRRWAVPCSPPRGGATVTAASTAAISSLEA